MQTILFLLALFFCSNTHQANASDQTTLVKTDKYDQTATDQLKKVLRSACEVTWKEDCIEIKRLIELRADPNTRPEEGRRLLHVAALLNDPAMVAFGLQHGGCAHLLPGEDDAPLMNAKSAQVAQLLLDNKATLDCFQNGKNILHEAINLKYSTKFLVFLSNAGIDPHAKDERFGESYLHTICYESQCTSTAKKFLKRVAVVSFLQTDFHCKNRAGYTPLDKIKKHSPQLVEPAQEVISVTHFIKRHLQLEQEQVGPLVSAHILPTLTPLVVGYAGLDKVSWEPGHWDRIQNQLAPATKALLEKQKDQ